jgi:hypothetical protein
MAVSREKQRDFQNKLDKNQLTLNDILEYGHEKGMSKGRHLTNEAAKDTVLNNEQGLTRWPKSLMMSYDHAPKPGLALQLVPGGTSFG